jgi:pyrroline-5-carboxylate reductase
MKIGFIGAGSMASALARGLGEPVLVHDPDDERSQILADAVGGEVVGSNQELAERSDLLVLAHKPKHREDAAAETAGAAKAVASIVAATPVARLEAAYPGVPVYRFLPNIPVEVGRGLLIYAPGSLAGEGPEDEVVALFGRCGTVMPLEEGLIEPAMALMSSGPAFMAVVVEALTDAGVRHGLDRREAARMVVETMAGTAAYLDANNLDAAELRHRVATPGGVTERGLGALEATDLRGSLDAAVNLVVEATR